MEENKKRFWAKKPPQNKKKPRSRIISVLVGMGHHTEIWMGPDQAEKKESQCLQAAARVPANVNAPWSWCTWACHPSSVYWTSIRCQAWPGEAKDSKDTTARDSDLWVCPRGLWVPWDTAKCTGISSPGWSTPSTWNATEHLAGGPSSGPVRGWGSPGRIHI